MLALSIGLATTGVYGLARAVNSEQWYRNIILHDSLYSCEQLLEYVYPELAKQNSWKLPVWYYIWKANIKSELAEEKDPVIQASASRHHHGGSDSWNTGNIASVNRHHHGCTINLCLLYKGKYFLSTTRFWIKKGGGS